MLKNGMRVRVYWNLHKNKYSVQDAKTSRVVAHVTEGLSFLAATCALDRLGLQNSLACQRCRPPPPGDPRVPQGLTTREHLRI